MTESGETSRVEPTPVNPTQINLIPSPVHGNITNVTTINQ